MNLFRCFLLISLLGLWFSEARTQTTVKRADTLALRTLTATKKLVPGDSSAVITLPSQSGVLALEGSISSLPVGTITTISTNLPIPQGYLACDGSAVARADYADLFGSIGTTYGAGDGSTTFNVPNLIDPYVSRTGLVAWWPFRGGAKDQWVHAYDATVNGALLTTDRYEVNNSAYEFDGNDDNLFVDSRLFNNGWAQWSFAAWLYLEEAPDPISILVNTSPHNGIGVAVGTGPRYRVGVGNAAGTWSYLDPNAYQSNSDYDVQEWRHIVVVRDGLSVKLYIDGTEDTEYTLSGAPPQAWCQLYFGKCDCGPGEYLKGKLDDIGLWSKALSPEEIQTLYQASSRFIIRSVR